MKNFFSIKSWFISGRKTKLNNDESCWLIFDENLFILFKFPIDMIDDDVVLWTDNDDVDDAVGIFIRFANGVNSADADLFVIDEFEFSIIAVWWGWWKLDEDEDVSRLTKFIQIFSLHLMLKKLFY